MTPDGSEWPRVSIVTTSYNHGRFIEETIRSVILQGYPNIEHIIIDGGSADNTPKVIEKYRKYIAYWISEPDRGQAHALNEGLRKATGGLIGWQNSDDYYGPGFFARAVKAALLSPETDIFYGCTKNIDANDNYIRDYPVSEFDIHKMLPYLNMCNQSMLFRKKVLDDNNFIDESFRHAMDQEFLIRLAVNKYKFKFYPDLLGYYRVHEKSKGCVSKDICSRECLTIYRSLYKNPTSDKDLKDKALSSIYGLCMQSFEQSDLDMFHMGMKDLFALSRFRYIDSVFLLKYLLSFLGTDNLRAIIRLKNSIYQRLY
jgi:glycosyltransferase involved in cell wall biosynthesis